MNVKHGDKVIVDGIEATVETSWGQGAHKAFKLSDGRVVLDLTDLSLAKVVEDFKGGIGSKGPPKSERKWDWLPHDGQHDLEE